MPEPARTCPDERRRRLLRQVAIHPLFRAMAARQGIDVAGDWARGLEGMLLEALERCATCAQPKGCQAWLGRGRRFGYPPFCPNARMLEACRIMDPRAPAPVSRSGAGTAEAPPSNLQAMLSDPLVRQVMRAARPNTARLLSVLSGTPQRLVARAVGVI